MFEISDFIISDWVSFLAYPNLFEIKGFVVVVSSFPFSHALFFTLVEVIKTGMYLLSFREKKKKKSFW
jgi:hypothetical protein